jgi:hypothetical protein
MQPRYCPHPQLTDGSHLTGSPTLFLPFFPFLYPSRTRLHCRPPSGATPSSPAPTFLSSEVPSSFHHELQTRRPARTRSTLEAMRECVDRHAWSFPCPQRGRRCPSVSEVALRVNVASPDRVAQPCAGHEHAADGTGKDERRGTRRLAKRTPARGHAVEVGGRSALA